MIKSVTSKADDLLHRRRNSTTPEILVEHIMVVRKFDLVKNLATNN